MSSLAEARVINLKGGFSLLVRWIYTLRSLLIEMETKEIKLYYSRFGKPDINYGWKKKVNFKQLYDDKDNFKYKSLFPKSTVE